VLLDGRDITDTPLEVAGTTDISGLRVVLTSRVTTVSGRVTDEGGKLVRDCSVVVFAEDAARWTDRSRFVATVRPDLDGRFEVTGLPPGAYLIVALEYVEDGAWGDPEFLESLRVHATKLALAEDEKRTVDLRLGRM